MSASQNDTDKERCQPSRHPLRLLIVCSLALVLLLLYLYRQDLALAAGSAWTLIVDKDRLSQFIHSFGPTAPLVFMGLQVGQVMIAPIPGEVSGFIGGYLFGAWKGFLYSSVGLTIGSWLNFIVARVLGKRYIRRLIPAAPLSRFEYLLNRQGVIVIFILFVFPGFPKDYLCLFLGLTSLPAGAFMLLASVGRMPGTLLLSFQGAYLYDQQYGLFAALLVVCLVLVVLAYRFRETLYAWIEKADKYR
jgi:uncharacterized membrane protein YdjX (TVP38/TMEM64 family)